MLTAIIKCPFPFPDIEATASVKIYQEQDTEDYGPTETLIYEGNAIYSQETTTTYNTDSKQIALSGKLIIKGDVQQVGNIGDVQGYVTVDGDTRRIYKMSKPKLLGMVYSTEVALR